MSRHCPRILDDHISAYTTKSPCMSENLFSYKAGARTFVGLITKTTGAHTRLSCIAAIHNYKQIPLGELRESTLTQCGGTVPCSTSTFLPYAATNYNTYFPPRIQLKIVEIMCPDVEQSASMSCVRYGCVTGLPTLTMENQVPNDSANPSFLYTVTERYRNNMTDSEE
jgi:hypothetical protein